MDTWPLTGRDRERDRIEAVYREGEAGGVVLAGDAGIGKTRLAREALAGVAATGATIAWITASRAAASIPFGVVAQLLPATSQPDADSLAVLREVTDQVGRVGPMVIGVDDAHLLDDESAATLAHLALRSLAFLVVTARCGHTVPDALATLWKNGLIRGLDLRPLPEPAVDTLIDHALEGPVTGLTRRRLHGRSAGNPGVLRQTLHSGLDSGALRRRHGVWIWRDGVARAVRAELGSGAPPALDSGARLVFELVALEDSLPLRVVERLAEQPAIELAERSGLIRAEHSGQRITLHAVDPLSRQTLPVFRTRTLYRRLTEAALTLPMRRKGDALRAARWQLAGGLPCRPDVLLAGAREAMIQGDLGLAERLARTGRGAAPGPDADHLLAEILALRGRGGEAVATLPDRPPEPGPFRVRWAVTRSTALYSGTGQAEAAARVLDVVPGATRAEAARSWILLLDGHCAQALVSAHEALAGSGKGQDWAVAGGVVAAGLLGRYAEAMDIGARGADVSWAICLAQLGAGDLLAARARAESGYASAVASGASLMVGGWAALCGFVAAAQGRLTSADESLREAVLALEDGDPLRLLRSCLAGLAVVSALRGEVTAGRNWLAASEAIAGSSNRLFDPLIELWRAWTQQAQGSTSAAARTARTAADLAGAQGVPTIEAVALYDEARLAGRTDLARLSTVTAGMDTPLAPVLLTAATGLSTRDSSADLLVDAATRFEALGHLLLAAEARHAAARAYRRTGHKASANVQLEKAAALSESCAGARTPLLARTDLALLLTRREREVALLAPTHTSREIAQRLGLTVHTVNNYLGRSYAKLNVSGRAELRRLLG